jgi:hypothetical protein
VAVLRRHVQRREAVLHGLVDLDALTREQELHHVGPPEERRPVKRRPASLVGLVHIAPLAEQPRYEPRVAGLNCAEQEPRPGGARHAARAPDRAFASARGAPSPARARQAVGRRRALRARRLLASHDAKQAFAVLQAAWRGQRGARATAVRRCTALGGLASGNGGWSASRWRRSSPERREGASEAAR